MNPSQKSRSELDVGTVVYYRGYEGKDGPKDRYFIVVAIDDSNFFCFTTTTQTYLLENERFRADASPVIDAGSTCLPKRCVLDYRFLYKFDDIMMTNRLTTRRAKVVGELPKALLSTIRDGVKQARQLSVASIRRVVRSLEEVLGK